VKILGKKVTQNTPSGNCQILKIENFFELTKDKNATHEWIGKNIRLVITNTNLAHVYPS
jgi:hypothetical protein